MNGDEGWSGWFTRGRRLVTVSATGRGFYEVTILPGAGTDDVAAAMAGLPPVVYLDHRALAPAHPAVVLTVRATPDGPDGMPVRPAPRGGPSTWVPAIERPAAPVAQSPYAQALAVILHSGAYARYGPMIVHALAHCDPNAVIAAADTIHTAQTIPG